ncbi:MAG: HDOD domain-containing protein [Myxococcales bacterium]|jgi:HD-like signal output (HDOD) protein|nr:HDOD domain-containing protein [Myxococcales bacterium]MBK7198003.1 HDOD domain-containing protein [Myxococcales bacterium]MBP6843449.1 HDOD domain-containing protein [Kofleriaceae bacterium]
MPIAQLSARADDPATYLRDRIARGDVVVPPYPAVAAALQALAANPKCGSRALAEVVGRDVALAAAVVRRASSAAAAGHAGILTLEQAVCKLGVAELGRLALAVSVGATATRRGPLALLRRDQWRHALLAAVFAQELAPRRGIHPDQAFLAGLIHDLGAVIAVGLLEEYLGLHADATFDATAGGALIQEVHVELGLLIAERWQLPEVLREIITYHHDPTACLRVYRREVTLIGQVERIIAALASPAGAEALRELPGLEHDERFRIVALLPRVGEVMASFAAELPDAAPPPRASAPPPAAPRPATFPVDFAVEPGANRAPGRATAIGPATLELDCPAALPINWLVALGLDLPDGRVELLANVLACARGPRGFHVVIAPFALNGPPKRAWLALLERARAAAA